MAVVNGEASRDVRRVHECGGGALSASISFSVICTYANFHTLL